MCGYSFYLNNALKIQFFPLNECVKRLFFHCCTSNTTLAFFQCRVCFSNNVSENNHVKHKQTLTPYKVRLSHVTAGVNNNIYVC